MVKKIESVKKELGKLWNMVLKKKKHYKNLQNHYKDSILFILGLDCLGLQTVSWLFYLCPSLFSRVFFSVVRRPTPLQHSSLQVWSKKLDIVVASYSTLHISWVQLFSVHIENSFPLVQLWRLQYSRHYRPSPSSPAKL